MMAPRSLFYVGELNELFELWHPHSSPYEFYAGELNELK